MKKSLLPIQFLLYTFYAQGLFPQDTITELPYATSTTAIRGPLDYENATPLTITKPGIYKITGSMSASGAPVIQITTDNVSLDLNGNTLDGGTTGISVTGNYVTIKNGTIQNTSDTGITLANVIGCNIDNCDIIGSATGIYLNSSDQNTITNVRSLSTTNAGFSLVSSGTNYFNNCSANNISNTLNAYGFISDSGSCNIFQKCSAQDIITTSSGYQVNVPGYTYANAAGFWLSATEENSSIIDCYVNGVSASSFGENGAYGIYLKPADATYTNINQLTSSSLAEGSIFGMDWLIYDGNTYLATVGDGTNETAIFSFDGTNFSLVTSINAFSVGARSAQWIFYNGSPYLAIGAFNSTNNLKIFSFNGTTLTEVASSNDLSTDVLIGLSWLRFNDASYLAVGGGVTGKLDVFSFNGNSLTLVESSTDSSNPIIPLDWVVHNGNAYLAAGLYTTGDELKIYSFDGDSLTTITTSNLPAEYVIALEWLIFNDKTYLAVSSWSSTNDVQVYEFTNNQLILLDQKTVSDTPGYLPLQWFISGSTAYLFACKGTTTRPLKLFSFDGITLTEIASTNKTSTVYTSKVLQQGYSIYLATGGIAANELQLFDLTATATLDATQNCLVESCITQNIHARTAKYNNNDLGVGLNADSTLNYSAKNFAQECGTNYNFIDSQYITSPANARGVYNIDESLTIADSVEVTNDNLNFMTPEVWSIESKCEYISDNIDLIPAQYPIDQATTTRTPLSSKTISQSGSYFLNENVSGGITISASNVTLDLNGFAIHDGTTGINVTGNNVTIKNGTIETMSGAGISLNGVSNNKISNCDIISTETGLLLSNSAYTRVTDVRTCNTTAAGFSLVSSGTNYFEGCKAVETISNNYAYGFASDNGNNNVFYKCNTQGIKTTSADGIKLDLPGRSASGRAAGFWFGTGERDSKIISCNIDRSESLTVGENDVFGIGFATEGLGSLSQLNLRNSIAGSQGVWSLQWVNFGSKNYLAVGSTLTPRIRIYELSGTELTLITQNTLPEDRVYQVSWLATDKKLYLTTTGRNNISPPPDEQIRMFEFDGSKLKQITTYSLATAETVIQSAWLIYNNRYYLGAGSTENLVRVFEFNEATTTLDLVTTNTSPENYAWSVKWLVYNDTPYLAAGGLSGGTYSREVRLYEFDGTSLTQLDAKDANGDVYSLSWLYYNNTAYLAAGGLGNGSEEIMVYSFNGSTLTPVTSTAADNEIAYSLNWFMFGGTPYLTAVSTAATNYEIMLYSFNGSTLTLVASDNTPTDDTEASADILVQDKIYCVAGAAGTDPNDLYLYEITGSTTTLTAEQCIIANNNSVGSTGRSSLFHKNNSTGINVYSSRNYVAGNLCHNNGYGINYLNVAPEFIASQANAHGVDNVDTDRTEVDKYESKLDVIIANL